MTFPHRPLWSRARCAGAGFLLSLNLVALAPAVDVLFVGAQSTPTAGADGAAMSYLQSRYGAANVTYAGSNSVAAGDEVGFDVVVLSSTPNSGSLRGKFDGTAVGVVNWEEALADNNQVGDFGVTSGRLMDDASSHSVRVAVAHPVTSGFAVGGAVVLTSGAAQVWWSNAGVAAGATTLAEESGAPGNGFLVVVEAGGTLLGGGAAAGRRVMFGMTDDTFGSLTGDGRQLFGQAVDWAAGASQPVSAPAVQNTAASGVSAGSATVGGSVTDTGGETPDVTLYWGPSNGGTVAGNWANAAALGAHGGSFATVLGGLDANETYYFRCFAQNSGGGGWAPASASFTTLPLPDPPAVVNAPATEIGFDTATVGGTVTATGGDPPLVTLFYGTSDGGTNPAAWGGSVELGVQSAAFENTLILLEQGTAYYYRSRAANAAETVWAPATSTFQTLAVGAPAFELDPLAATNGVSAVVTGRVTETGGQAPEITVFYGTSDGGTDPGAWGGALAIGPWSGDFEAVLSGLEPLATYHFAARAQNAGGTAWAAGGAPFETGEVSPVRVNEFMAQNSSTAVPGALPGRFDDWIEIHNAGAAPVAVGGWHLTDDPNNLTKWTVPGGTTIGAGGFLVVFASGDGVPDANGNLHANFGLDAGGEYLALVRPDLTVAWEFDPGGVDYPDQVADVSYGLAPLDLQPVYFGTPTPGAPNDPGGFLRVADTTFDFDRGYYDGPIDVTIESETEGASIYFTTDGRSPLAGDGTPEAFATLYSGPVPVARTTVLRAAAVKAGHQPTDVDTQTYFLMDLDPADPQGLNVVLDQVQPPGYANLSSGDYAMDGSVARSGQYEARLLEGLQEIPAISIAMEPGDFAGPDGLYTNSTGDGFAWERACSAEFIPVPGSGRDDWQVDCGIRAQGGASRNPSSSPKHALSLRFRERYGTGQLRERVFPDSDVEEFDVLALRSGYNNSWIHRDDGQRSRGSMIRDQWVRDSLLDMGQPHAGHGYMVHLYVNGLYWGVHNLCERQDAAHYAAYHGGDEDDYDSTNGGQFTNGNATAWNAAQSVVAGGDWGAIQQVLDVDNYIDYQIINRYGANHDLKSNGNWRSAGGGSFTPGQPTTMAPWRVYAWDSERTLESPSATNEPIDPMGLRSALESVPDYRLRFADRLQRHFFNGGALTPDACAARWMERAAELDLAIVAESARWGDHRRGSAYTRDNEWIAEQNRLLTQYFPVRSANVFSRFRSEGLYPSADAPAFLVGGSPQHGGEVAPGQLVSFANVPGGTIYYTLDGSDPRVPAGGAGGGGGSTTVLLDDGAPARALVPLTDPGTGWRAPGYNDSSWLSGTTGVGYESTPADYQSLIGLDVGAMEDATASVFIRVAFEIGSQAELDAIGSLTLNMRYDDGFVAFLNGDPAPVASANDPSPLLYNSEADGNHTDSQAVNYVPFNITAHTGKLVVGSNVLAIHGLNSDPGSSDLLISPQLVASDAPVGGGELSPSAIEYTGPFVLPSSGTLRARALVDGGTTWTAINEAEFYAEPLATAADLRITEIHYHPADPTAAELAADPALGAGDFEFVEIMNVAGHAVNLSGVAFTDGVDFTFGAVSLGAGQRIAVVSNPAAFELRYGAGLNSAGPFAGGLSNGGETIVLGVAGGGVAEDFRYDDSGAWPGRPDGRGSSLEIVDTGLDPADPDSWRASVEFGGTPGEEGVGSDGRIVVNEVRTNTLAPEVDAVEFANTTGAPLDVSGWFLTDDNGEYRSFQVPAGTPPVPAGGYIVFDESDFNPALAGAITGYAGSVGAAPVTVQAPGHGLDDGDLVTVAGYGGTGGYNGTFAAGVAGPDAFTIDAAFVDDHATKGGFAPGRPFALSGSRGEELWLVEADAGGDLLGFVDHVEFPAAAEGGTLGRFPDGGGINDLYPAAVTSLGSANTAAQHGPVVITEIMFQPSGGGSPDLEFVEVQNTGGALEPLDGWRLRGGADFDFGPGHSLAPGAVIVLVGFDPADAGRADAFRSAYPTAASATLVGPWSGGLGDDGDTVRVQRAGDPPPDDPLFVPQLTEDEARYLASAPWPPSAAGGGDSLARQGTTTFGRFASSWVPSPPDPGVADGAPALEDYDTWALATFGPGNPPGSAPGDDPELDGLVNAGEFILGMDALVADASGVPSVTFEPAAGGGGGTELVVQFTVHAGRTGVGVTVERSRDMFGWSSVAATAVAVGADTVTYEARLPADVPGGWFVRLRFTM